MPGDNCCFNNCNTCRNVPGERSFFGLPKATKDHYKEWREEWISVILKYRVLDKHVKKQIEKGTIRTCDRHYHPHEIISCKLLNLN